MSSNPSYVKEAETRQVHILPVVVFPPTENRPCFTWHDSEFKAAGRIFESGVYYHDTNTDIRLCPYLRIVGIVSNSSGEEYSYLLEFIPIDRNTVVRKLLPFRMLAARGEETVKVLGDWGISFSGNSTKLVLQYLDFQKLRFSYKRPQDFLKLVNTVGWDERTKSFVLPTETIGQKNGIFYGGKGDAKYARNGTLTQWREKLAKYSAKNPHLILTLCSAFLGPLLKLLNIPGAGFHFYGDSSTGKSSALFLAASVWGEPGFALSWRTTLNALELQAAARSCTLLILDESHLIEPKHLDGAVYVLTNGYSKSRMTKDIEARSILHWIVCILSSGERSIGQHLTSVKITLKGGQAVRIVDIPVSGQFGIFDCLHNFSAGNEFADYLRDTGAKFYGNAGPCFVEHLIHHLPKLDLEPRLSTILDCFAKDLSAQSHELPASLP
jgi:putative DNA primase/helicase